MKPFYFISCCLIVLALAMDIVSKKYYVSGMKHVLQPTQIQSISTQNENIFHDAINIGKKVHLLAFIFFGTGVILWGVSVRRKENCKNVLVIILVFAFIALQFIFV